MREKESGDYQARNHGMPRQGTDRQQLAATVRVEASVDSKCRNGTFSLLPALVYNERASERGREARRHPLIKDSI